MNYSAWAIIRCVASLVIGIVIFTMNCTPVPVNVGGFAVTLLLQAIVPFNTSSRSYQALATAASLLFVFAIVPWSLALATVLFGKGH